MNGYLQIANILLLFAILATPFLSFHVVKELDISGKKRTVIGTGLTIVLAAGLVTVSALVTHLESHGMCF